MVPRDYKRVLEAMRAAEAAGRDVDAAVMAATDKSCSASFAGAHRA